MGVDEGHADNHDILRVRYVYHQDTKSNFLQQGTLTRNVTERERRMGRGGGGALRDMLSVGGVT